MPSLNAHAQFTPRSSAGQFVKVAVLPSIVAAMQRITDAVVTEAKALCPVDTGDLQDSIEGAITVTEKTVVASISAGMDYAGYVEFGTGIRGAESPGAGPYPYNPTWPGMVAQPYMRPAIDSVKDTIKDTLNSSISIGLKT